MKRFVLVSAALLLLAPLAGSARLADAPPRPAALSDFFKTGSVFLDKNGDGVVDFVDARLALPDKPVAAEITAAANIAARLGFETSAMDLPVARAGDAAMPIFVGARSLAGSGASADSIGAGGLKAGDGAVASFTLNAKPAIAVLGGDDASLLDAATM